MSRLLAAAITLNLVFYSKQGFETLVHAKVEGGPETWRLAKPLR